jgi:hypothetical protein
MVDVVVIIWLVMLIIFMLYGNIVSAANPLSVKKNEVLTVFLSLTSGPHTHKLRQMARQTWLSPCIQSHTCDYRYFIDTRNITAMLAFESQEYGDLVFRDSCDLMLRHPDNIHYGNSPVEYDEMFGYVTAERPNYYLRRMYKVDWKNCFMRWARDAFSLDRLPLFHVYVEDDSFTCMDNLLHQTSLLENIMYPRALVDGNGRRLLDPTHKSFRSGYPQRDGFDDSSTFMNKEIVEAFLQYYPSEGFDCAKLLNNTNEGYINMTSWLSWGNSWISSTCNWPQVLKDIAGLEVNRPLSSGVCAKYVEQHPKAAHLNFTKLDGHDYRRHVLYNHPEDFPCFSNGVISHGADAVEVLLTPHNIMYNYSWHICEYFLLIDKVKSPGAMMRLWNATHFKCRHIDRLRLDSEDPDMRVSGTHTTAAPTATPTAVASAAQSQSKWDQYNALFGALHANNRHSNGGGRYLRQGLTRRLNHVAVDYREDCPNSFTLEDAAKQYTHHYHNMSIMFLRDGQEGFKEFINNYVEHSYYCHLDSESPQCKADLRRFRRLLTVEF